MKAEIFKGRVEELRHIAEAWQLEAQGNDMGILVENVDKYLAALHLLAYGDMSHLLVLYDGETPVGLLGLNYFESPLGPQKVANEHYFFVIPKKRGHSSMRLIKEAKVLARMMGCSHLIMNASNLASDLHDRVCKVYEKMNMTHFETSFITEI